MLFLVLYNFSSDSKLRAFDNLVKSYKLKRKKF